MRLCVHPVLPIGMPDDGDDDYNVVDPEVSKATFVLIYYAVASVLFSVFTAATLPVVSGSDAEVH